MSVKGSCVQEVDFSLYLITNRKQMLLPLIKGVEEALKGGVRAVQLREKDLPVRDLLGLAMKMRKVTSRYGAKLFINDRLDVALSAGADGVHIGNKSIPVYAARRVASSNTCKKKLLLGVSTHSLEEAVRAEREGADFITFGPLFDTPSKRCYGPPLGTESLRKISSSLSIPIFGLGGIKAGMVSDVLSAGASGVALISAILSSENIQYETDNFVRLLS